MSEVYLASQRISYLDKGGFHVSTGGCFKYLSFSNDKLYRILNIGDIRKNTLREEVVNSTHVY